MKNDKVGFVMKLRQVDNNRPLLDLLYNLNSIKTASVVVKKSILIKDIYFNEDVKLRGFEDFDLWLHCLVSNGCKFRLIKESLGFYSFSENDLTQIGEVQIERLRNVYQPYIDSNIEKGLDVNKIKAVYSNHQIMPLYLKLFNSLNT